MNITIRPEHPADARIIRQLTETAFKGAGYSSGTEGAIIDALRAADALTISLVATINDEVVGHVAVSPVKIGDADNGWFGIGPVSVRPDLQSKGIGSALIRDGLGRLRNLGANGCVVLGNPDYYRRFGFAHDPALRYPGPPPEYFMRLSFGSSKVSGRVSFHPGFSAS